MTVRKNVLKLVENSPHVSKNTALLVMWYWRLFDGWEAKDDVVFTSPEEICREFRQLESDGIIDAVTGEITPLEIGQVVRLDTWREEYAKYKGQKAEVCDVFETEPRYLVKVESCSRFFVYSGEIER
ncbi:hypothetical protein DFP93_101303 [Aneurinibacillus soli]|uniref:Uncharacterized protein n=1 Tax=Aneurinibacillus soli TaxID=1500254 RepID=A0A0U5B0X2_9BACL|nr:hypothetical protein [Aneurinibacillus soli]PYE64277.1 hypothetical protein DFP93_101303 [Aneurinibacillus soli]BAU28226.1 hypothetical protein CB4_02400 [Aneurinibacillus soli]